MPVRTSSSSLSSVYERHAKPAFTGTVEAWQKLPWNIKQYYSPPPETPPPEPTPKPEPVKTPIYGWRGSPYGVQRRVIVGYTTEPSGPTPLELKKEEYSTFAKEYVKPVVESTVEAIKEAPSYKPPSRASLSGFLTPIKPPYLYREIEKIAEQVARQGGPTVAAQERVGHMYFAAGVVKAAESFFKPEIRTAMGAAASYTLQRPKQPFPFVAPIRSTAPLSEYAKTLPSGYRGRAELLGELAGEYLIGRYIVGPALERGYGKAKQVGSTIKKKVLGPSTIETGWQRTALGTEGWQYKIYRGVPGEPQIPSYPSFIRQEGMEEFVTQTARATSHPVSIHIERETPWRVIIKHPPTPMGGGLTQTILRSEISDVSKLALRGVSKKTLLAPYWMAAYAPKPTSILSALFGVSATALAKAVTTPEATRPKAVTPKIGLSQLMEVPKPIPILPTRKKISIKPILATKVQKKRKKAAVVVPKLPTLLTPQQRKKLIPTLKPSISQKGIMKPLTTQKVIPSQLTKSAQAQQQKQIQRQRQMMRQMQVSERPLKMKIPTKFFEQPKRKRKRRAEEDVFGLFGRQKRFWPVMSPKQVMRFAGLPAKKRRRR